MQPTHSQFTADLGMTGRPFAHFARQGVFVLLAAALLTGGLARADTIILKSGTGTLPVEGTIVSIDSTDLIYLSASTDRQTKKQIDAVLQIKAPNEAKLTAAEQAYADGKWSEAVTNYQSALNSSSADWVKARAMVRLIDAAAKSQQFAPQVAAFIELCKRDPANAKAHRPDIKGVKADQINAVVGDVERNANNPSLKKESTEQLKTFLADLYVATGKMKEASAALVGASPTPAAMASGNPGAGAVAAPAAGGGASSDVILTRAKIALASNQYQSVINDIEANKTSFTDPAAQAEALYDVAKAKDAMAGTDPVKLQDAAIAYMRVVAHFSGKAAGTMVPAALYRVGTIEEQLRQTNEAVQVYQTLTTDPHLQGSVIAAEAAKRLAAIKAAR